MASEYDCHPERSEGSFRRDAPCAIRERSLASLGMTVCTFGMTGLVRYDAPGWRAPASIAAEHLLDLVEEAFRLGRRAVTLAGGLELLEQLLLTGRQVHRRLD